jgi:hypothetical protein
LTVVTVEVYAADRSAALEPAAAIRAGCYATDTSRAVRPARLPPRIGTLGAMELLFAVLLLVTMLLLDLQTRT